MIFIDIDGTLTDSPNYGGNAMLERIEKVRQLIEGGSEVTLWSGNGTAYAKKFASDHNILGVTCISKPHLIVDDNPTVRPLGSIQVIAPEMFFKKIMR